MERTEKVELTALCLIDKDDKIVLHDRVKMIGKDLLFQVDILKSGSQ